MEDRPENMVKMATFMWSRSTSFLAVFGAAEICCAKILPYSDALSPIQSSNKSSFCFKMLSRLAMEFTMDSTDWLVCRIVSGETSGKEKIFCSFSPSAFRICASPVCCSAIDSNRSETA